MAAAEHVEDAGNADYHDDHMGTIFKQGFSFSGYERDLLTWNQGDGTYRNISGVSGVDSISDGRGSVFADFDNDGDSDIFLTTAQREAHYLFRNNVGSKSNYLRVELTGDAAIDLLNEAVAKTNEAGLPWCKERLQLKPAKKLIELIRKSQELAVISGADEGGD